MSFAPVGDKAVQIFKPTLNPQYARFYAMQSTPTYRKDSSLSHEHFPDIKVIAYEGPKTKNRLAFRHYNPDEVVGNKGLHVRDVGEVADADCRRLRLSSARSDCTKGQARNEARAPLAQGLPGERQQR